MKKFLIKILTQYLPAFIKIFKDFKPYVSKDNMMLIKKENYVIEGIKVEIKEDIAKKEEVEEFLTKNGVITFFEKLIGKYEKDFKLLESSGSDNVYLYFTRDGIDKMLGKVDVLVRLPLVFFWYENGYRLSNMYTYIISSKELTFIYSKYLGINIIKGDESFKVLKNLEWITTFIDCMQEKVSYDYEKKYSTSALKSPKVKELYFKYILPYVPKINFDIIKKLEDDSIPSEIKELAEWRIMCEYSPLLRRVLQLPKENEAVHTVIKEYNDYLIILVLHDYKIFEEPTIAHNIHIVKAGKVIFIPFWIFGEIIPTVDIDKGIIEIENIRINKIVHTFDINEIIKNKNFSIYLDH